MKLVADLKCSDQRMSADFKSAVYISEHERAVYESRIAQLEKENKTAFDDGFVTGINSYRDRFWSEYTNGGKARSYPRGFYGPYWNDITFDPSYDIIADDATSMFYLSKISDLAGILEKNKVDLSVSNAKNVSYMFYNSGVTTVPPLNISNADNVEYMFNRATKLVTVPSLIVSPKNDFGPAFFAQCNSLENLTFDGYIGCDVNLKDSPLTYDSIYGIVFSLSADIETEKSVTFSRAAVDKAFESSPGANDGSDSEGWRDLCKCRPMWYIGVA